MISDLIFAGSDRELGRSYSGDLSVDPVKVTRSIMILRPAGSPSAGNGSPPVSPATSPAGSTPPVSPFFGKIVALTPDFEFPVMAEIPLELSHKGECCGSRVSLLLF